MQTVYTLLFLLFTPLLSAQTCPTAIAFDINGQPVINFDNEAQADFFVDDDATCPPGATCNQIFSYTLDGSASNGSVVNGTGLSGKIEERIANGPPTLYLFDPSVIAANGVTAGVFTGTLSLAASNNGNVTCTYTDGLAPGSNDGRACPTAIAFNNNGQPLINFNSESEADFFVNSDACTPPDLCNQLFFYTLSGTAANGDAINGTGLINQAQDLNNQAAILLTDNDVMAPNGTSAGTFSGTLTLAASNGGNTVCQFGSGLLPVTYNQLTAVRLEERVYVRWTTQQELNNNYFEVQRSSDGSTFRTIARVVGGGTSDIPLHYEYVDHNVAASISYYRLLQVDFDESTKTTSTLVVGSYLTDTSLNFVQNPVQRGAILRVTYPLVSEQTDLEIYTSSGRVARRLSLAPSTRAAEVSLVGLPDGYYIVRLRGSTVPARQLVIVE